eukprot:jgi/Psemu1/36108/gm1.36108_g
MEMEIDTTRDSIRATLSRTAAITTIPAKAFPGGMFLCGMYFRLQQCLVGVDDADDADDADDVGVGVDRLPTRLWWHPGRVLGSARK